VSPAAYLTALTPFNQSYPASPHSNCQRERSARPEVLLSLLGTTRTRALGFADRCQFPARECWADWIHVTTSQLCSVTAMFGDSKGNKMRRNCRRRGRNVIDAHGAMYINQADATTTLAFFGSPRNHRNTALGLTLAVTDCFGHSWGIRLTCSLRIAPLLCKGPVTPQCDVLQGL